MLINQNEEHMFDKRVRDKLIERGIVDRAKLEKSIATLEDSSDTLIEVSPSDLDDREEKRLQGSL